MRRRRRSIIRPPRHHAGRVHAFFRASPWPSGADQNAEFYLVDIGVAGALIRRTKTGHEGDFILDGGRLAAEVKERTATAPNSAA